MILCNAEMERKCDQRVHIHRIAKSLQANSPKMDLLGVIYNAVNWNYVFANSLPKVQHHWRYRDFVSQWCCHVFMTFLEQNLVYPTNYPPLMCVSDSISSIGKFTFLTVVELTEISIQWQILRTNWVPSLQDKRVVSTVI